MQKKYHKHKENRPFYRINERIFANELRVLDAEGKQIGLMSKFDALSKARELELDLVEIASTAKPPVAKIIDFKKFLYQQEKKKREEKRKAKVSETKEIRLGPFMNDHDLEVMIRRGKEFLEDGDKVRLVVKFKGRQITHPEFGQQIIKKVVGALAGISKVERDPHFEGKQLTGILAPERKKSASAQIVGSDTQTDEKNTKVSPEKI